MLLFLALFLTGLRLKNAREVTRSFVMSCLTSPDTKKPSAALGYIRLRAIFTFICNRDAKTAICERKVVSIRFGEMSWK